MREEPEISGALLQLHSTVKLIAETEQVDITLYSTSSVCLNIAEFFLSLQQQTKTSKGTEAGVQTEILPQQRTKQRQMWKVDKSS